MAGVGSGSCVVLLGDLKKNWGFGKVDDYDGRWTEVFGGYLNIEKKEDYYSYNDCRRYTGLAPSGLCY